MFTYLNTFCTQNKKMVSSIAAFIILLIFGDTLLHFVAHVLHILLEVVESLLEHFLEEAFGLSPRQAQIVLFYSFLIAACYASWRIGKKAYIASLQMCETCKNAWPQIKKHPWFRATIMLGALGTTVYLFS